MTSARPHCEVSYPTRDALKGADERELKHGGCMVQSDAAPAAFSRVLLTIRLPGELVVDVPATVVIVRPDGRSFFVQFDAGDEADALRSAVSYVLSTEDAPHEATSDEPPEAAVEPVDGDAAVAPSGPLMKPVWELVDAGSSVPLHAQVRELSTQDKIRLARHATRPVRALLIRDSERRIHNEVIQNPRISDEELVEYTADPGISPLALRWVASQRRLVRHPGVLLNLVMNPQSPTDIALNLLGTLNTPDLLKVSRSSRVREAIMRAAKRKLMETGVI